jgi:hypothetical protein
MLYMLHVSPIQSCTLLYQSSIIHIYETSRSREQKKITGVSEIAFFYRQFMRKYEDTTRPYIPEDIHGLTQPYHLVKPLIPPCAVLFTIGSLHPPYLQIFNIPYCFQAP